MPRRNLERVNHLPYLVTVNGNNREPFAFDITKFWQIIGNECLFLTLAYEVEFHAVVLMPNHIQMILTVPSHDLGIITRELLKSISKRANLISGRSGHIFSGPYRWSLINNPRYFGHILKFIYQSPTRAGLCHLVEEYPYSTLHGLIGGCRLPFPLYLTRVGLEQVLPSPETGLQLEWLNQPFPSEAEILIKKALRQKFIEVVIDRKTRKPSDLLTRLI